MPCGRGRECLRWHGPIGWPRARKTGRTVSWRAGNSCTVQSRPTARTCTRLTVRRHRRRRLSTRGRRSLETTTTFRTDAAACAGTTRKSSGATRKKWDAQWREGEDARSGSATTIRRATGPAGGPTKREIYFRVSFLNPEQPSESSLAQPLRYSSIASALSLVTPSPSSNIMPRRVQPFPSPLSQPLRYSTTA